MYAKLIHPRKIIAAEGRVLRDGERVIVNPTPEDYAKAGYLPVVGLEEVPTEGEWLFNERDGTLVPTRNGGAT